MPGLEKKLNILLQFGKKVLVTIIVHFSNKLELYLGKFLSNRG